MSTTRLLRALSRAWSAPPATPAAKGPKVRPRSPVSWSTAALTLIGPRSFRATAPGSSLKAEMASLTKTPTARPTSMSGRPMERGNARASLVASRRSRASPAAATGSSTPPPTDRCLLPHRLLAEQNRSGSIDLYDARVAAAFPTPANRSSAIGDSCQALPPNRKIRRPGRSCQSGNPQLHSSARSKRRSRKHGRDMQTPPASTGTGAPGERVDETSAAGRRPRRGCVRPPIARSARLRRPSTSFPAAQGSMPTSTPRQRPGHAGRLTSAGDQVRPSTSKRRRRAVQRR